MRRKLNAMALEFVDKNVLLVDGALLPSLSFTVDLPLMFCAACLS